MLEAEWLLLGNVVMAMWHACDPEGVGMIYKGEVCFSSYGTFPKSEIAVPASAQLQNYLFPWDNRFCFYR